MNDTTFDTKPLESAMAEAPAKAAPPIPQGGLEVISIAKSYDKRAVLNDVSLSVGKGEVLGLLGPNGAGKTTCFYSIMGLVKPDSGRILMDGMDVTRLPMYRRAILGLGYLPQETSIFRGMTVEQNIAAVLEMVEPDKEVRAAELDRLLDEFGLTALREQSGDGAVGRRAAPLEIARALCRQALDRPAGRAVCGHRPAVDQRHPQPGEGPQAPRHRRADHRPQCARDARHRRSGLHHLRRACCCSPEVLEDLVAADQCSPALLLGESFTL